MLTDTRHQITNNFTNVNKRQQLSNNINCPNVKVISRSINCVCKFNIGQKFKKKILKAVMETGDRSENNFLRNHNLLIFVSYKNNVIPNCATRCRPSSVTNSANLSQKAILDYRNARNEILLKVYGKTTNAVRYSISNLYFILTWLRSVCAFVIELILDLILFFFSVSMGILFY